MSKLDDLRKEATTVLATVHPAVAKYVAALESSVRGHVTTWYAIGAAICLVAIVLIVHHLKHG